MAFRASGLQSPTCNFTTSNITFKDSKVTGRGLGFRSGRSGAVGRSRRRQCRFLTGLQLVLLARLFIYQKHIIFETHRFDTFPHNITITTQSPSTKTSSSSSSSSTSSSSFESSSSSTSSSSSAAASSPSAAPFLSSTSSRCCVEHVDYVAKDAHILALARATVHAQTSHGEDCKP